MYLDADIPVGVVTISPLQGHIHIGDLLQTNFPLNCFDVVYVRETFGYLGNQHVALEKFRVSCLCVCAFVFVCVCVCVMCAPSCAHTDLAEAWGSAAAQ